MKVFKNILSLTDDLEIDGVEIFKELFVYFYYFGTSDKSWLSAPKKCRFSLRYEDPEFV